MSGGAKRAAAPRGLGEAGRALWRSIVKEYELRPDELAWLRIACRATDVAEHWGKLWAEAVADGEEITINAKGEPVPHPASAEMLKHAGRAELALAKMKLDRVEQPGTAPVADGENTAPVSFREHQARAGRARQRQAAERGY